MDVQQYTILPDVSVKDAIQAINDHGKKVVLITDAGGLLLGMFSDGDMRRYILRNGDLNAPVSVAMNRTPVTFHNTHEVDISKSQSKMVVYPIVDDDNHLLDVVFWNDNDQCVLPTVSLSPYPVIIMAGGKGTRLYPYTKILPKPLIPIGDYTISERIINSFVKYGCNEIKFILNYKKSMIKAYFNDLEKPYNLTYFDEEQFLGTGGGLSLLKGSVKDSCFVTNCDILVDEDYTCIMKYHKAQKNKITFVCAMKNITIPYGVVTVDCDGNIDEISEKPSFSFLTNTGLYIVEPDVIDNLIENEFIHLPDIAQRYIDNGERVGVYPVSERSWLDMGQFKEMENMYRALGGE